MMDDHFFLQPEPKLESTGLYGLPLQGSGTGEVESLHSYVLALAHAHSLSPNNLVREALPMITGSHAGGFKAVWGLDKRTVSNMVGATVAAAKFAEALTIATGRSDLRSGTLVPVARHICGQSLVSTEARLCTDCLEGDLKAGRLPFGRLLWCLQAVTCCPIHGRPLVPAICGASGTGRAQQFSRRKLGGSCGRCGSMGYNCVSRTTERSGTYDLWKAQQCLELIATLPAIDKSCPLEMKDAVRVYCSNADGTTPFAHRVGAPKSLISRWINHPTPRLSLDQFLDIAASEQFSLARLMVADLTKTRRDPSIEPSRVRRPTKRLDHLKIETALKEAIDGDQTIQDVASRMTVDPSTLARHEDLYTVLKDRNRERHDLEQDHRHATAVAVAERTLLELLKANRSPSLRNASSLTGDAWFPGQLRAVALQLLRISLGDRRLSDPSRAHGVGERFSEAVAAAADRLRVLLGDGQQALQI